MARARQRSPDEVRALIDRHERKWFLLTAQCAVFSAEAVILALLVTDHISYRFLLVSSTASSIPMNGIRSIRK